MTTFTRPQLIEALAAASTNHAIALDEETMAWNEYDLAVETLSGYQVTLFGQRAEFATTARIEAYRKVDTLKAQLLEREEIAAALDTAKASLTKIRILDFAFPADYADNARGRETGEYTKACNIAAGVFAGQIVNHL